MMPSSVTSSDGASIPSDGGEAEEEAGYYVDDESSSDTEQDSEYRNVIWTGYQKRTPVLTFDSGVVIKKRNDLRATGEKYHLAYKIVRTECRLVRSILSGHGFHEAHPNSSDFNLMWTGSHLKPYVLRSLTEHQKVNHFPRSYELTRKDRMYKNIQKMQQTKGFKHFDFVPTSYVLPGEFQEFCTAFLKDKGPWIVKPIASSRGRGIFLVSHPDQIPLDEQLIVCKYIQNPLLVDDFKFDVRLYVAVTSYDPLVLYLYEEGLARFATVKYDKAAKNMRNQCMHLTNYSVNKKNNDYVHNDDADVEDYGNKWSLGALLRYLRSENMDTTAMMMRVEDVVIKSILSVEPQVATASKMFMPFRGNCFELYGFDILIDEKLRPWVLEVNLSPSLACDSPLDLKIKGNMMADLFSLVGFVCHDPMVRKVYQSKRNVDVASKTAARSLKIRVTSAKERQSLNNNRDQRQRIGSSNQRSRPQSAGSLPGSNRNISSRNLNVSGLSGEEIRVVRRTKEELKRRGGWVRIFPSPDSWDLYGAFMQNSSSHNVMLHQRLFPDKNIPSKVSTASYSSASARIKAYQLHTAAHPQLLIGQGTFSLNGHKRSLQYEGKIIAIGEMRKKKRTKRPPTAAPNQKTLFKGALVQGVVSETLIPTNGKKQEKLNKTIKSSKNHKIEKDENYEETLQVDHGVHINEQPNGALSNGTDKLKEEASPKSEEPPPSPPTPPPPPPKYNVVELLLSGGCMSKVQARTAFATYLSRVQQRLITEHGINDQTNCDAHNEQMEKITRDIDLVLRFLKRAAGNLQKSFKVVVPSRRLPINDRRRILAKQLGDFVHIYSRETEQLRQRQHLDWRHLHRSEVDKSSLDEKKFSEFLAFASECELEDVLTTYTKIHKSASIFLGGGNSSVHHRPSSASSIASNSDASLLKRRDGREYLAAEHYESTNPVEKYTNRVSEHSSDNRQINAREFMMPPSTSAVSQNINPLSSYASAIAIYSAKFEKPRPSSASYTAGRSGFSRPSSAFKNRPTSASGLRQNCDMETVSGGQGDGFYEEDSINDKLQRLTMKQQSRQYSSTKSNNILNNPSNSSNHVIDVEINDHPHHSELTVDNHSTDNTMLFDDSSNSSSNIKMQLTQLSQRLARHNAQQHAQSMGRSFTASYYNATQSDSDLSTSAVKTGRPINNSVPKGLNIQMAAAQQVKQQREQSKALLEQSKAKHQAMVAQAHASYSHALNNSTDLETAVQHYTPKPPPVPLGSRKPVSNSRINRTTSAEEDVPVYSSHKYDTNFSPYRTKVTGW